MELIDFYLQPGAFPSLQGTFLFHSSENSKCSSCAAVIHPFPCITQLIIPSGAGILHLALLKLTFFFSR